MKELTIKEALEQGYEYCIPDCDDFGYATEIHDGVFEDFGDDDIEYLYLCEKEPIIPSLKMKRIKDVITDLIYNDLEEVCPDERLTDSIDDGDYNKIAAIINNKIKEHKFWVSTDIKLIRNEN